MRYTDGAQGFQMTDVDGRMELTFDEVDVSDGGVALSIGRLRPEHRMGGR